ncbi:MAG: hypothetical protein ACQEWU_10130 [Bacillota bacterium]
MSIVVQPQKPQKLTIEGVKFFKKHLDKIKLHSMVTDDPLTTSEISVFMILHLYTDEMGQIRSFTNDSDVSERKQLCISNIAAEHELTYETVKKAFDSLLYKNYIAEVYTDGAMHYEIVDYAKYNQEMIAKNNNEFERSSYFRIPLILFQEKIFGKLITQRYHKGPILLLDLCQYFTVQIGTTRRSVDDVKKIQGTRTMTYLKKSLNTTAKRVRNFLTIVHNVFQFKPLEEKIKHPNTERNKRKRTFVQICIDKFSFSLNGACFKENDNQKQRKTYARCKKEMSARIKNSNIPVKWRDMLDINKSISRMVNLSQHYQVVSLDTKMLNQIMFKVADTLETLHNNNELKNINRLGAFVNKCFTNALNDFNDSLSESENMDIMIDYYNKYGDYPTFIK